MRLRMRKRGGSLNGVMYALFHLRNLEDARANQYMYNIYDLFTQEFDDELQTETIMTIELALESGDINQFCNLPGIPGTDEFKIEYLKIVLSHLKEAVA